MGIGDIDATQTSWYSAYSWWGITGDNWCDGPRLAERAKETHAAFAAGVE